MPALGWANTAETSLLFELINLLEYSPLDPGAKTMIWQQALGHIGNEDRVARIRVAGPDFLDRQIVRQMTGTDDLDAVIKK